MSINLRRTSALGFVICNPHFPRVASMRITHLLISWAAALILSAAAHADSLMISDRALLPEVQALHLKIDWPPPTPTPMDGFLGPWVYDEADGQLNLVIIGITCQTDNSAVCSVSGVHAFSGLPGQEHTVQGLSAMNAKIDHGVLTYGRPDDDIYYGFRVTLQSDGRLFMQEVKHRKVVGGGYLHRVGSFPIARP